MRMRTVSLCCLFLCVVIVVAQEPKVVIQYGENIQVALQNRVTLLVSKATSFPVSIATPEEQPLAELPTGSYLLSFGKTATASAVLDYDKLVGLGPEGFLAKTFISQNDVRCLVGDGNPGDPSLGRSSGGAAYAMYRLLGMM